MQKRVRNSRVKGIAISEISVMIIAIFAFAVTINEIGGVLASTAGELPQTPIGGGDGGSGIDWGSSTLTPTAARGIGGGDGGSGIDWSQGAAKITPQTPKPGGETPGGAPPVFSQKGLGGHLWSGLQTAGVVVGAIMLVGQLAGWQQKQTTAVAIAAGAGIMAYSATTGILAQADTQLGEGVLGITGNDLLGVGIGAAVAVAVLFATYKKETEKSVSFSCVPWQPPIGGAKCEECNKDPLRPCTEYRCRSLGQACQLLNKNTPGKEKCAWVNPKDVESPTITPWNEPLAPAGLSYISDTSIRPPALGVKIVKGDGCLQAFTPLVFGINTNEPAQCRVDFNHTGNISEMQFYFGESGDFEYNHTQKMRLPGPAYLNESAGTGPVLQNDGTMQLFVRCMDANGNQNADEYSVKFCVDKSPDTTAPSVESISIPSGNPVRYNADKVNIAFYLNEPSECRWGIMAGQPFETLPNAMECAMEPAAINAFLSYTCIANFTGIKNQAENKFYIRCKDNPGKPDNERNVMTQDYVYTLKGSQPLNIVKVSPNATTTVRGSTEAVSVDLTVETDDGAEEGKAICYFSPLGTNDTYVQMAETNNYQHKQTLQLTSGNYKYWFSCTDLGGNTATATTSFTVFSDRDAPKVSRVYKDSAGGLKVVTNEDAECAYSLKDCNFIFDDGIKLVYSNTGIKTNSYLNWAPNTVYYVKCRDMYGNEPNPNTCSITIRAVETSVTTA